MADVHVATDLADAVAFLDTHAGRAVPVAGGTDLVVDRRLGRVDPRWLVDLTRLDGLRGVAWSGSEVSIGALTTIRAIERDRELAQRLAALTDAAAVLGSVQVRTMATLGGNLGRAAPSAEMAPPLLVQDAHVEIAGPGGARTVAVRDLFTGPGHTCLSNAELLTRVRMRAEDATGSCYLRQTVRWAMDLAGVGVAALVRVDGGVIVAASVALGAVAPVPFSVPEAAAVTVGAPYDDAAARRAGEHAAAASRPIADARGPAEYRRRVVAALVPRALRIAWLRATGALTGPVPQHGMIDGNAA